MTTERNLDLIEDWVRDGTDLSRGDFTGADLANKSLYDGKFRGADFTDASLRYTDFEGSDLTGATLIGANLYCADLSGANLTDANLTGAALEDATIETTIFTSCKGIFDAGTDWRGYRFVGVKQADGSWRIKAGCRWYTAGQAIEHWEDRGNDDALDRVNQILASD